MFYQSKVETIPFTIDVGENHPSMECAFTECKNLKELPKIIASPSNMKALFQRCNMLREIDSDNVDIDGLYMEQKNTGNMQSLFNECCSLRKIPMRLLEHGHTSASYSSSIYSRLAGDCYALDEIVDLPNPHYNATWTSNAFTSAVENCYRLKDFIFKTPNGMPYAVKWKSQTINLSTNTGWSVSTTGITKYNSGITADKEVKDDATYQALKNDPDWFTCDVAYSRYNHDSAVATINSLPDASAYLATAGGTNTIKFKGAAGSATDGGAINTLTEEEIAVATAKGWTVSLV
jgi:hypothetical protein